MKDGCDIRIYAMIREISRLEFPIKKFKLLIIPQLFLKRHVDRLQFHRRARFEQLKHKSMILSFNSSNHNQRLGPAGLAKSSRPRRPSWTWSMRLRCSCPLYHASVFCGKLTYSFLWRRNWQHILLADSGSFSIVKTVVCNR